MLLIRCDSSVPGEVVERVCPPLERAARRWMGLAEAFVYCVPEPGGARELVIRVSTSRSAVPVLFRIDSFDADEVETAVAGTLRHGDF